MSDYSLPVSILSAQTPNIPAAPTTTFIGSNLVVSWTAPISGGSPITAYRIKIRHSDGVTFSEELTSCDGTNSAIVTSVQCSIPSSILNAAPFNIGWGDSVWAKLSAINAYGESSMSLEGNGGIIITKPDPPRNIVEDIAERTLNSVGFYWQ